VNEEYKMRLGPWLVIRGVVAVVVFLLLATFTLARTTPGAAEQTNSNPGSTVLDRTSNHDQTCRVSLRYPQEVRQWCGWITQYAELHGLQPNLIAGLIWYESGGNPTAYSRSGAVGLMQVMPRDGLAADFMCINGPCFANRPTRAELEDPEFNIEYGTRMLAGLLNRRQDLREALKSYGPAGAGYSYADKVLSIFERYSAE
jgi:soluble lytic murein transglycosylase-like protein